MKREWLDLPRGPAWPTHGPPVICWTWGQRGAFYWRSPSPSARIPQISFCPSARWGSKADLGEGVYLLFENCLANDGLSRRTASAGGILLNAFWKRFAARYRG